MAIIIVRTSLSFIRTNVFVLLRSRNYKRPERTPVPVPEGRNHFILRIGKSERKTCLLEICLFW